MGWRISVMTVALAGAVFVLTGVAAAGVENNPNVFPAEDLTCDNGFESDQLLIIGRTGHTPPQGNSGVAMKVELFVPGPGWVPLFDVPGQGLDKLTTPCTWTSSLDGSAFRGDILLRGNLR